MDRRVAQYAKVFRKAVAHAAIPDADECVTSFARRLEEMYASDLFTEHSVYPTINVGHVYAVIAMCLELREHGLADEQVIACVNVAFAARIRAFDTLLGAIDLLPNCYAIARRWNIGDHGKRMADGSIDYVVNAGLFEGHPGGLFAPVLIIISCVLVRVTEMCLRYLLTHLMTRML